MRKISNLSVFFTLILFLTSCSYRNPTDPADIGKEVYSIIKGFDNISLSDFRSQLLNESDIDNFEKMNLSKRNIDGVRFLIKKMYPSIYREIRKKTRKYGIVWNDIQSPSYHYYMNYDFGLKTTKGFLIFKSHGEHYVINAYAVKINNHYRLYLIGAPYPSDELSGRVFYNSLNGNKISESNFKFLYLIAFVILIGLFLLYFKSQAKKNTNIKNAVLDSIVRKAKSYTENKNVSTNYNNASKIIPLPFRLQEINTGQILRMNGMLFGNKYRVTLGREILSGEAAKAHIKFNKMETTISRKQAEFYYSDGVLELKNLSQTNPTLVNDVVVSPGNVVVLRPGDIIRLGRYFFKLEK
jgi:hypothetical protein